MVTAVTLSLLGAITVLAIGRFGVRTVFKKLMPWSMVKPPAGVDREGWNSAVAGVSDAGYLIGYAESVVYT